MDQCGRLRIQRAITKEAMVVSPRVGLALDLREPPSCRQELSPLWRPDTLEKCSLERLCPFLCRTRRLRRCVRDLPPVDYPLRVVQHLARLREPLLYRDQF